MRYLPYITLALLISLTVFVLPLHAQKEDYSRFFEEAYRKYPNITEGTLEAIAFTNTRMHHLVPDKSPVGNCSGLPKYYGVMGLVENGEGYFKENLKMVAELSGYSIEEIKQSPRINILAFAAAYSKTLEEKNLTSRGIDEQQEAFNLLSELPQDGTLNSDFEHDQQFYSVLREYSESRRAVFDYNKIFGAERVKVLTAPSVNVSERDITGSNGSAYLADRNATPKCTQSKNSADFAGAIWSPAASANYGKRSGDVKYITIHTIQGSYASCISWFRNPKARVSAHYAIRSFDGQITQMVCEDDKAYHVRADNDGAIGLEHEGFVEDGGAWYSNEMYEASAALVRDICERHDINPLQMFSGKGTNGVNTQSNICRKIKGHQHFPENDHVDPGIFWDWNRYYRLVNGEIPEKRFVFNEPAGEITDDGGKDKNYGDGQRIAYFIQPAGATSVTLEFTMLDIEGTTAKPFDYLDIYAGKNPSGERLARLSGSTLPPKMTIKGGNVYLEFVSDCRENKAGWVCKYYTGNIAPKAAPVADVKIESPYPFGATMSWGTSAGADSYLVYIKNTIEEKWRIYKTSKTKLEMAGLVSSKQYEYRVVAIAGKDTSAAESGNFLTPNVSRKGSAKVYTTNLEEGFFTDAGGSMSGYNPDEDYQYLIAPAKGKVKLTFNAFNTEESKDIMTIYDGSTTSANVLGRFSGTSLPPVFTSSSNALLIQFKSDSRNQNKGWSASWTTIGGNNNDNGGTIVGNSGNTGSAGSQSPNTNTNNPPAGGGTSNNSGGSASNNSGGNNSGGSNSGSNNNAPVGEFSIKLVYGDKVPTVTYSLPETVTKNFSVTFTDKDKSGTGIAQSFYVFGEKINNEWTSNPQKGFLYEDFDKTLRDWKSAAGTWSVKEGVVRQTNTELTNTNLYVPLIQDNQSVYVFNWQMRMLGSGTNKRAGAHFFCADPQKEDRGASYFIWARDGAEDKIEIYKVTANDEFKKQAEAVTTFAPNKVHDIKTVYNPTNGKIEVYINNTLALKWIDADPIQSGKGFSLRSAGCIAEFDNIRVFKSRKQTAAFTVGSAAENDVRTQSVDGKSYALKVISLTVDNAGKWSEESIKRAKVKFEGAVKGGAAANSGGSTSGGSASSGGTNNSGNSTPPTGGGSTPLPSQPSSEIEVPNANTLPLFVDDFSVKTNPSADVLTPFFLPTQFDGQRYTANESLGFAYDMFDGNSLYEKWKIGSGKWQVNNGVLVQTDEASPNSNLYLPVTQNGNGAIYLYAFKVKLQSAGDNKRWGIHVFAQDGSSENRGNSYMVWFRNNDTKDDLVEIYRSVDNELKEGTRNKVSLAKDKWMEVRISLDTKTGTICVWMDGKKVSEWKDNQPLIGKANFVSFRTGTASVAIDDFRMYQLRKNFQVITVGAENTNMVRNSNTRTIPAAKILMTERMKNNTFQNDVIEYRSVRFK